MKKIITLVAALSVLLTFTACSSNRGTDGKNDGGMMQDAGNAVNDVLDGAENVVDDMTGSNKNDTNSGQQTNNNNNKTHENNADNNSSSNDNNNN